MSDETENAAGPYSLTQEMGESAADFFRNPRVQHVLSAVGTAIPVVLVNVVAFIGQFGYLRDHLPWALAGIIMAAVALESIAIYLAWQAHQAQLANDSASRLRLSAYALALVIGAMNYSHYMAPHWRPTVPAVMLGLMSSISPWLWSVHSRRVSRDRLMKIGLVEPHSVRLGATRWLWHPLGAFRVMRRATWFGTAKPDRAIDDYMEHGAVKIRAARQGAAPPRATPAPSMPAPSVPELAQEAVPAIEAAPVPVAQDTVPAPPVPAVPARALHSVPPPPGAPVTPPAVHHGSAHMSAHARVPAGVSDEVREEVAGKLAALPVDELPSVREVARMLGDPNQRRLGARLLSARQAAEAQRRPAPVSSAHNGHGGQPIAPAQPFIPGGVPVG